MPKNALSMTQVAKQAGVSTSTVSRYLRGELRLKESTEQRIREILHNAELKTFKTQHARSFQRVALVVPSLVNPFFADLAEYVVQAGVERGVEVHMLVTMGIAERETAIVDTLLSDQSIDGILFVGMNRVVRTHSSIADKKPLVVVDEPVAWLNNATVNPDNTVEVPASRVVADNFGGAFQATSYLVRCGHKKIAHIGGPENLESAELRFFGYAEALRKHDLPVEKHLVVRGAYSESFGANSFAHLSRIEGAPSAVFAASDIAAVGVLAAADTLGIIVPRDLSLVGFDGISAGRWMRPTLSTVAQPTQAIAEEAFEKLLADTEANQTVESVLPMELMVRGSTANVL